MMTFTNWLTQAFATFSTDTLFYTERLAAFKKLHQPALLSSQKENYRTFRTFLAALIDHPYHFNSPNIPDRPFLSLPKASYVPDNQSVILTFIDGIWSPENDLHQAIALQRLADLPFPRQQELWSSFMSDMGVSDGPSGDLFSLLNQMLSQETYLLEVEPDRQVNIVLQHIITDAARHIVPQLMVKIGSASQVTLLENWCTAGTNLQPFVNNATHIVLDKRARLDYHALYTDCPSLHQVNHLYCTQKDHTTFTHHNFSFGAAMIHMNLRVHINGSHASAALYGLSTLYGTENVAHQIQVVHSAPNSLSKQHYKSILGGASNSGFSGKIYLTPAAQQTNAYQTNNALILSDAAYHYTKPQLEIYADDVKCSHGATAGQLDEEQLFYLQARGIALPLAKRLLLEAFGSEIIHSLSSAKLQAYLSDKLVAKLVKL